MSRPPDGCTCSLDHIDAESHLVLGSVRGKVAELGAEFAGPIWPLALNQGAEHEPSCPCSPRRHKPGPKPDPTRAKLRQLYPEMSARTFTTFYIAWLRTSYLESQGAITHDKRKHLLKLAVRPNGTINVSRFARIAHDQVAFWLASQEGDR